MKFKSVEHVRAALEKADYICSKTIATVVYLAQATQKPVLVEGPAGVGKTELSKAVARSLDRKLIRLQCYEGLDANTAMRVFALADRCDTGFFTVLNAALHLLLHQHEAPVDFVEKYIVLFGEHDGIRGVK